MLSQLQKLIFFKSHSDEKLSYQVASCLSFIYPLIFLMVERKVFSGNLLQYFCVVALCLWASADKRLLTGLLLFFTTLYHLSSWQFADNHQWLYWYWVIALFLNEMSSSKDQYRVHAQSLLFVVFALATFWKLLDGEYLDGSFFQFEFIADKRLQGFVDHFLSMDFNQVRVNAFISETPVMEGLTPTFYKNKLLLSDNAVLVARILSYLTVITEGALASLLLIKIVKSTFSQKWIDWPLFGFFVVTYALLPVHGFASILIILAIAQAPKEMVKFYLLALVTQLFTFTKWS